MFLRVEQVKRSSANPAPAAPPGSDMTRRALELARAAHEGQTRKDGSPYVEHPIMVAQTLGASGFDEEVIAAGLLHDVVEDTDVDPDAIHEDFGDRVLSLVVAMTDDKRVGDYAERKRNLRAAVEAAGTDAVAIFAADKLANLQIIRAVYSRIGEQIAAMFEVPLGERISIWHEDVEMVARGAPDLPYLRDLRYQLESFEEERAARPH